MGRIVAVSLLIGLVAGPVAVHAAPGRKPLSATRALKQIDTPSFQGKWKNPGQKRYWYKHPIYKTRLKSGKSATLMLRPGARSGRLVIDVTNPAKRWGSRLERRYVVKRGLGRRLLHNLGRPGGRERAISHRQAARILGNPGGATILRSAGAELRRVKKSGFTRPVH